MPRGHSNGHKQAVKNDGLTGYFKGAKSGDGQKKPQPKVWWGDISPETLSNAIAAAHHAGVALLFGSNRDNTALALGLFRDGAKQTFYFNGGEDYTVGVEEWLWEFIRACNNAPEDPETP